MLAFGCAGETGALEAGIGFVFDTEVMLAFGYAGETGGLEAWKL